MFKFTMMCLTLVAMSGCSEFRERIVLVRKCTVLCHPQHYKVDYWKGVDTCFCATETGWVIKSVN